MRVQMTATGPTTPDGRPPTMPDPGGVPAHQPVPEVPPRGHPTPGPDEMPIDDPPEVPADVPTTPGPAMYASWPIEQWTPLHRVPRRLFDGSLHAR